MRFRWMPPMPGRSCCKGRAQGRMRPPARCLPTSSAPPPARRLRRAPCWRAWRISRWRRSPRLDCRPRFRQSHDPGQSMSVSLTLDQVKERARRAPMVPIFRDMLSDALTPVTAFAALGKEGPAFLLESVEGGEHLGRYSFVAADPMAIISIADGRATVRDGDGERALKGADPWKALESYVEAFRAEPAEGLPEGFCGGAVGYLGYEAARYLEHLPVPDADPLHVPDGVFIVTDTLACFDHVRHRLKLVTHVRAQQEPIEERYAEAVARIDRLARQLSQPVRLRPMEPADRPPVSEPEGQVSKPDFFKAVERAKSHILAGDIYQVQIAQRFTATVQADPFDVYGLLGALDPLPYMYHLKLPHYTTILTQSPAQPVRVQGG